MKTLFLLLLLALTTTQKCLASEQPESLALQTEERDLEFLSGLRGGRVCRRNLLACQNDSESGTPPFADWLSRLDDIPNDNGNLRDGMRDIVNEASSMEDSAWQSGAALDAEEARMYLRQLRSIMSSMKRENLASSTQSILDVFKKADDVSSSTFGGPLSGILQSILGIILAILFVPVVILLLPVLGVLLFFVTAAATIGILVFLLQVFIGGGGFRRASRAAEVEEAACRADLLLCEYRKFENRVIPGLIDVIAMLGQGDGLASDISVP